VTSIGGININSIINQTNIQKDKNGTDTVKAKLENAQKSKDEKKLMKACKEFESIFVHMLLKQMRSTIQEGGLIEKSTAREMFEDMYDQELAKEISQNGEGMGLAKILFEQMKNNL
jgi:flagellar protein FlgJ